ncbi:MAG TPA: cation diffusion facilitator family transporter [Gemmataceae bacterium]|jgi:cation diffusion facilitator family transporter|nr:cation diffusion facilitator family transporter [Gemmataceae bacterium]
MSPAGLRGLILLSVLAALITIGLKAAAYSLTRSVGLLSDALESGINLFAAVTAYLSLHYSQRPVDATHTYGHQKIEFFSSGLEGVLIVLAGIGTAWYAVHRLIDPEPISDLGIGAAVALAASAVNLAVGVLLVRVGKRHHSLILEADGRHLLTDVWTSLGIVAGLVIVWLSGYHVFDPVIAILVGANIVVTGVRLIYRSFNGLMDHALDEPQLGALRAAIRQHSPPGTDFHALRTRQAGARKFADFHLLVPGAMSVRDGHDLAERVEAALRAAVPGVEVTIHIEPIEEKASFEDNTLKGIEPPGNAAP